MNKSLRVIFMGTPAFAVAGLRGIIESHHDVVAVVTTLIVLLDAVKNYVFRLLRKRPWRKVSHYFNPKN